jgi:hypothetical protein
MDSLLESALNAAALRPEQGTVAEAFQAQAVLRAMTEWHQQNESEVLPTALLCMLVAAREVC